jgi:hypothetical protein
VKSPQSPYTDFGEKVESEKMEKISVDKWRLWRYNDYAGYDTSKV